MHWHILGAGSIGCLWAAHLAEAGHDVTLIVRNRNRQQTLNNQITLERDNQLSHWPVYTELASGSAPIENLLVTTKAFDVQPALLQVRHRLQPAANVVLLHNGMGPQQWAQQTLTAQTVWAASTTDGGWLRAPGHIVFAGRGETRLGRLDKPQDGSLAEALQALTLTISADNSIEDSLWRKLAINCAINPLTALHGCCNGELVSNPAYQAEMAALCTEVDQLLATLQRPLFENGLLSVANRVATATGHNYSSMLQDVRHRRPTEIDFITGYLCQQTKQPDTDCPKNNHILQKVKKIC
ncbi:MAG: 2-dehydropantoate 2-reductase [Marinobacterium sp.]|nr:2-dehydropantoate 2-reductase [Marinobacterium sp.]